MELRSQRLYGSHKAEYMKLAIEEKIDAWEIDKQLIQIILFCIGRNMGGVWVFGVWAA